MHGSRAVKTWANLNDLRLMPGDIGKAIAAFKKMMEIGLAKAGVTDIEAEQAEVRAIGLNPKNKELAREVGDGIEVIYSPSILLWEVWLYEQGYDADDSSNVAPEKPTGCNKIEPKSNSRPGRKVIRLPVDSLGEMQAGGMSLRDIAKSLGISHMTVYRTLRKLG